MQPRYADGSGFAAVAQVKCTGQRWLRIGLWMCAWAAASVQAQTAAVQAAQRDDRGQYVALAQPAQRIVSLLPSLTETVCALGACDRLVGIDRYSSWPAHLPQTLPTVGGGLDPNIEAIVALKPDVVLLANSQQVVQRLHALGVRTVVLEPRNVADVERVMHSVGHVLGLPSAQVNTYWQGVQARIDAAVQDAPDYVQGTRFYFEVNQGPYAAGPASFIGELMQRLGAVNVVPAQLGPFPRLSPEFVLRAQPQVILLGSHSAKTAPSYPGWAQLPAVQQQRVCAFSSAESDVIVRPGPRMDEAARILARCLTEKAPHHAS